eukprot:222451-Pyramimonas_sp.AAC.1
MDFLFGGVPRPATSVATESRLLDLPPRDAALLPLQVAAVSHYALRSFLSSLCSHLTFLHDQKHIRLICAGTFLAYDETPLSFAVGDAPLNRVFLESALEARNRPDDSKKRRRFEKQTCKVLQSDFKICFIFEDFRARRIFNIDAARFASGNSGVGLKSAPVTPLDSSVSWGLGLSGHWLSGGPQVSGASRARG